MDSKAVSILQWETQKSSGEDLACTESLEAVVHKFLDHSETGAGRQYRAAAFEITTILITTLLRLNHFERASTLCEKANLAARKDLNKIISLADVMGTAFRNEQVALLLEAREILNETLKKSSKGTDEHVLNLSLALRLEEACQGDVFSVAQKALKEIRSVDVPGKHHELLAYEMIAQGICVESAYDWLKERHQQVVTETGQPHNRLARLVSKSEAVMGLAAKFNEPADDFIPVSNIAWTNAENEREPSKFEGAGRFGDRIYSFDKSKRALCMAQSSELVSQGIKFALRDKKKEKFKGVVFLCSDTCFQTAILTALPSVELQKRGFNIVGMYPKGLRTAKTGIKNLDKFRDIFIKDGAGTLIRGHAIHPKETYFEWLVDWNKREIKALGLNFWQPVYERVCRILKRCEFDETLPSVKKLIVQEIASLDHVLFVCEEVRRTVAPLGKPIRFVSCNWQYPPVAAFRIYCEGIGHEYDMEFVAVSSGYEHYYNNMKYPLATTATVLNMTKHATTRAPFLAIPEKFEKWRRQNDKKLSRQSTRSILEVDRARDGEELPPQAKELLQRFTKYRKTGGRIVWALGKVVYDLSVPRTGGPAHTDIGDWINHTVDCLSGTNTILLVKPHPHELRHEIAGRPSQKFLDLIKLKSANNVVKLEHNWFNIADLTQTIDLAVMWNGSSSLELGASGVPLIICDEWGALDYPVGHASPRNRTHYEATLQGYIDIKLSPDYSERCSDLIDYMKSESVMMPYDYAFRSGTNAFIGRPYWYGDKVQSYLKSGDPVVEEMANRFKL